MNFKSDIWARDAIGLLRCDRSDLPSLVAAANLDPYAGDLAAVDFSDLDLRGQNLSSWDLRHAIFRSARIAGTDLRNAKVNARNLFEARGWQEAIVDEDLGYQLSLVALRSHKIEELITMGTSYATSTLKRYQYLEKEKDEVKSSFNRFIMLQRDITDRPSTYRYALEQLSNEDVDIFYNLITRMTKAQRELSDEEYLLTLCRQYLRMHGTRNYIRNDLKSFGSYTFDYYIQSLAVAIEIKPKPAEQDQTVRRDMKAHDIKVVFIYKSEFDYDQFGYLTQDKTKDTYVVSRLISRQLASVDNYL